MQDTIYEYLRSIMKEELKESFVKKPLLSQGSEIGFSYQLLKRALLRIKTAMRDCYRIEFFNYQDGSMDIKKIIDSAYEIKETNQESLRLIIIDVPKSEKKLLDELHRLEQVFIKKIDDIHLNFSPVEAFGCCHRFEMCSDAKKCLLAETEPMRARGCIYRKNLESNRIFYGKNRNV